MIVLVDNLAPCGAYIWGGRDPAVALRSTAGYAHLVPCGTKTFVSGIFVVVAGNPLANYSLSTISYQLNGRLPFD
ncbi:MAG: hypothetical protein LBU34_05505 [Planctomycetaceae bacterium]|nr:hypothetical protein [Planctomycetaceae bacterium]